MSTEEPMTYAGLVKAAMERPPLSQCLLFAGGVEERPPFQPDIAEAVALGNWMRQKQQSEAARAADEKERGEKGACQ